MSSRTIIRTTAINLARPRGICIWLMVVMLLSSSLWRSSQSLAIVTRSATTRGLSRPSSSLGSTRRAFLGSTVTTPISTVGALSSSSSSTSSGVSMMTTNPTTSTTTTDFWNRETSRRVAYDSNAPIVQSARMLCIADPDDANNTPLYNYCNSKDRNNVEIVKIGTTVQDFASILADQQQQPQHQQPNVLFVSHANARAVLTDLLPKLSSIKWIHARSAGIDFMTCPALSQFKGGPVTNSKGSFSSTLAEYTLFACSYFAKDLPRLLRNQRAKNWEKYSVLELRGASLGVIGYGDIGKAAARLARAYGMKVIALKRSRPKRKLDELEYKDEIAQVVYYGKEHIPTVFSESDYILCAAPLTEETRGMIGKAAFDKAKPGAVFINVGRGPIVDELAMIEALQAGKLKGAALDVVTQEPLPTDSPLWSMPQVLLSPHNMDQTDTFMNEATEFFVQENLPRFLRNLPLLNPVDPQAGY